MNSSLYDNTGEKISFFHFHFPICLKIDADISNSSGMGILDPALVDSVTSGGSSGTGTGTTKTGSTVRTVNWRLPPAHDDNGGRPSSDLFHSTHIDQDNELDLNHHMTESVQVGHSDY